MLGKRNESDAEQLIQERLGGDNQVEMVAQPRFTTAETMECLKYYARGGLLERGKNACDLLDLCLHQF